MQLFTQYTNDPLNDYRLIIDLPPLIKKKVAAVKTTFDADYKGTVIAGGNPFIYLATFSQHESAERLASDALDKIALGFMPFKAHLKNFAHLENNEIFIDVEDKEPIQYLVNEIKEVSKHLLNPRFNEVPRVSIAMRLQPWQFEKSWKIYAHKHISATFLADKMLLLKRMEGFRSWQVLKHMAFQNQFVI